MVTKSTSLVIRLPKELKAQFETVCSEKEEIVSETTRSLIRDYVIGTPSLREVLNNTQGRLDLILTILQALKEPNIQLGSEL